MNDDVAGLVERLEGWALDLSVGRKCIGADQDVREAAARITELEDALRTFANESLFAGPHHQFVCVPLAACDRARKALGDKP